MHKSVATIASPEFINLQPLDINPLMSACEIKVMYVGESRNRTYMDKDTIIEMSKTLRGAPIVGHYRESSEDFTDHGEQIIIDDEGVKFKTLTVPYGFVAPDAKVWFKTFNDFDDMGNSVEREYLMTTGYLWTGQFPECELAIKEGRPHSMELDEDTLKGHWSENYKNGIDFFIVNDAVFSKLCILGEATEPCFEGSSVTAPNISASFTLDDNFKNTLFTMMRDLQNALKGGYKEMPNENIELAESSLVEEPVVKTEFAAEEQPAVQEDVVETEFVASKKEEDDDKEESSEKEDSASSEKESDKKDEDKENDDDEDKKKKYEKKDDDEEKKGECKHELENVEAETPETLETVVEPATDYSAELEQLKKDYENLQNQYSLLEEQCNQLQSFKNEIEDAEKDKLINSFYMLSDEDKADIIANKRTLSYTDIEKELSVICYHKQINFVQEKAQEETNIITFSMNEQQNSSLPEWVRAVKEIQSNN